MTLPILISLTSTRAQVDLEAELFAQVLPLLQCLKPQREEPSATCSMLDELNASAMLFGRKAQKATR